MNIFKRILGHLFCLYALVLFFITLLMVVIPVLIINATYKNNEYKRTGAINRLYYIWMQVFMNMIFCPVSRKNAHYFQNEKNYVVILNHNSFLDIPISSPWVPGPNKTLAKTGFMKVPIFNIIYKAGTILVERESAQSRKKSFKDMLATLEQGIHLTLYPEGTRNKSTEPLLKFHDGAFRTALSAQKDIIIGVMFNTKKVLPDTPAFWGWPHRIRIDYLPPISIGDFGSDDVDKLKTHCHNLMKNYYLTHR